MNLIAEYKTMLRNIKLDSVWTIINRLTNNESLRKVSLNMSVLNTFFTESVSKIRSDIIKPDVLPGDFLYSINSHENSFYGLLLHQLIYKK